MRLLISNDGNKDIAYSVLTFIAAKVFSRSSGERGIFEGSILCFGKNVKLQ